MMDRAELQDQLLHYSIVLDRKAGVLFANGNINAGHDRNTASQLLKELADEVGRESDG